MLIKARSFEYGPAVFLHPQPADPLGLQVLVNLDHSLACYPINSIYLYFGNVPLRS